MKEPWLLLDVLHILAAIIEKILMYLDSLVQFFLLLA